MRSIVKLLPMRLLSGVTCRMFAQKLGTTLEAQKLTSYNKERGAGSGEGIDKTCRNEG